MSRRNRTHGPRSLWTRLAWLVAIVCGLVLARVEARHRSFALGAGEASDAPDWIWRDHDLRHVQAARFFAVKEFDLVATPPEAEIRILGDAEYLLTVNGTRIGSNRYGSGAEIDRYRVERWLAPGRNRLVVELRSPSGAGGLWFELRAGGLQLVRSDRSWSIYETQWRGLFGARPMPPGAVPRQLGPSPLGRWGSPNLGPERPAFEAALGAEDPIPAQFSRVTDGAGEEWQVLRARGRRPPSLGPLVEFDFGVERTGYLQLAYRDEQGRGGQVASSAALLAFGDQPIGGPPWTAAALFQPIQGSGLYQDSTVRRFRYVAVAGLPGVFSAEVLATSPESWSALAPRPESQVGIFGIPPPPSSAPVEHKVWRELKRTASGTVGEER